MRAIRGILVLLLAVQLTGVMLVLTSEPTRGQVEAAEALVTRGRWKGHPEGLMLDVTPVSTAGAGGPQRVALALAFASGVYRRYQAVVTMSGNTGSGRLEMWMESHTCMFRTTAPISVRVVDAKTMTISTEHVAYTAECKEAVRTRINYTLALETPAVATTPRPSVTPQPTVTPPSTKVDFSQLTLMDRLWEFKGHPDGIPLLVEYWQGQGGRPFVLGIRLLRQSGAYRRYKADVPMEHNAGTGTVEIWMEGRGCTFRTTAPISLRMVDSRTFAVTSDHIVLAPDCREAARRRINFTLAWDRATVKRASFSGAWKDKFDHSPPLSIRPRFNFGPPLTIRHEGQNLVMRFVDPLDQRQGSATVTLKEEANDVGGSGILIWRLPARGCTAAGRILLWVSRENLLVITLDNITFDSQCRETRKRLDDINYVRAP
ncbi:MAG: hypothetical protein HY660_00510 [Armatimonadetes bacterium]|nr:hypothetical protein [Armatimonadota bacterium]